MKLLITIASITFFITFTVIKTNIIPVLLSITVSMSLYLFLSYLSTTQKEKRLLKEENQYLIDSFQDIRNPITLIHTPLRNICNNTCTESIRKELSLAIHNIDSLNEHLTKLMGLKHLHIQSGKLDITECELGNFLKNKIHSLQSYASDKHTKLEVKTEFNYTSVWFDQSKISLVIEKFITSAIDHVEPETNITLLISLNHEYWEIKTTHSGTDKLAKIYKTNRHWLHRHNTELECKSAKDLLFNKLIKLCNGKIIMNQANHTISLKFPVKCSYEAETQYTAIRIAKNLENEKIDILFQNTSNKRCSDKPIIVLVDSNDDFRSYLEACLSKDYIINSFRNGSQALTSIKEEHPDLVICDSELRGMSGDELSSRLKTSCDTSIIPIILYGSPIDMNQHSKRKASLADTFLYMPFNIENLKIEMSVLIKNYRFLRKSFLQKIFGEKFLETDIEEVLEEDSYQLINKVKKIILDNLDKESLKIDYIASETGMSRTKFFNQWKSLTGEAPVEFMTRIRLEKAHELLESGKYRIQEIPEMIGLKDVKNFRNKYKKHFGIAPSETLRKI